MTKSNVIYVDFKKRTRIDKVDGNTYVAKRVAVAKGKKAKVLSKSEMDKLSKRVEEINQALNLCDDNRDADVIENLERELNRIEMVVRSSLAAKEAKDAAEAI